MLWLPGLVLALAWGARHPRIPASLILTLLLLALATGALAPLPAHQLARVGSLIMALCKRCGSIQVVRARAKFADQV